MGLNLTYNDGQTPLDEEEKEGLLIKSIATRGELDEFEQKNIEDAIQWSVDKIDIPVALRSLIDDASYWLEHNVYKPEEFAIRFKHRLVSIHCFPNGNGRHSRMIADIMIEKIYQQPVFSWGGASLSVDMDIRAQYLKAIRKADKGEFDLLLKFARS